MNSSYPRSDRPSLQRRPLTAPAPIRPLPAATDGTATATTMTRAVSKPHPLRRRAVSHATGPIEDEAEGLDDAAVAAEELREIVANLSLRQLRRPFPDTDTGTTFPNQADSRATAAAAAVRKSSPPSSSSSSYLSRALPRTPSRGSRNGGVVVPLKQKASHGGSGGTGISLSVPESAPMQVDTPGDELDSPWAIRDDKGRRRDTPPWIGLDGKRYSPPSRAMTRNPFLRQTTSSTITSSSAFGALPPHPQIVRAATEPVLPLPPPSASSKLSTKT